MRALLDKRVLFFGGKGGVGKTTCASAMALAASRAGKRVLLVSTDPAHSTSDMFEREIGPEPVQLLPNLHGLEIDGAFETQRYVKNVKEQISDAVRPPHPEGSVTADRSGREHAWRRGDGAVRSHRRLDSRRGRSLRPDRVRHRADRPHACG